MHFSIIFLSSSNAWPRSSWQRLHISFGCSLFFRCSKRRSHARRCSCIDVIARIRRYGLSLPWGLRVGPFLMRASVVPRGPRLRPCLVDGPICAERGLRPHSCILALRLPCFWAIIGPFYRSWEVRSHPIATITLKVLFRIRGLGRKEETGIIGWEWMCGVFFGCSLRKRNKVCWKWSA